MHSIEPLVSADLKYPKPKIDAVFLSHAHIDHIGHIKFINKKSQYIVATEQDFSLNQWRKPALDFREHEYETFRSGDTLEIGHLVVEPIHVDHSITTSYSFIIDTSKGPHQLYKTETNLPNTHRKPKNAQKISKNTHLV